MTYVSYRWTPSPQRHPSPRRKENILEFQQTSFFTEYHPNIQLYLQTTGQWRTCRYLFKLLSRNALDLTDNCLIRLAMGSGMSRLFRLLRGPIATQNGEAEKCHVTGHQPFYPGVGMRMLVHMTKGTVKNLVQKTRRLCWEQKIPLFNMRLQYVLEMSHP